MTNETEPRGEPRPLAPTGRGRVLDLGRARRRVHRIVGASALGAVIASAGAGAVLSLEQHPSTQVVALRSSTASNGTTSTSATGGTLALLHSITAGGDMALGWPLAIVLVSTGSVFAGALWRVGRNGSARRRVPAPTAAREVIEPRRSPVRV
jgi:hypothetical protein